MDRMTPHRFFGTTLGEWIELSSGELTIDAISISSVITGLRGFDIHGNELNEAVRECLTRIMARGARPIQGHNDDGDCFWTRVTRFGDDPAAIVEGVIAEWHAAGIDPEIGDIWFALPDFIESECRA